MSSDASRTTKVRMIKSAFTIDVTLHCTAVAYMVIMSNRV
jgi:pyruvate/oxaloacetate carboxyltransferase